ncbi:hypothetical protein [Kitasatospora sp. NPDC005856]|uniref:hypothetical protein n=1 Tax=Kitasatospora sp. NPDC005856 TaxID=3154566 RepID=UPI0033FAB657
MTAHNIVDLDDPNTWPASLADRIDELADEVPAHLDTARDLNNQVGHLAEYDSEIRTLLAGRLLRTYHVTRLLDHEIDHVRTRGLLAVTEGRLAERADRALKAGVITEAERAALRASTALTHEKPFIAQLRLGKVCVISSRQPLADSWPVSFLTYWGGEVQQFGPAWESVDYDHVRRLGRPSVVVAAIDVTCPAACVPGRELLFDFIGTRLGLDGNGVTFHYTADIPGEQIVDIWRPGHPEYDQHLHFPQA